MPKSPFVLTFGAKNSIIYGHGIKIAEYRDFLEIIFELHFRLSLNGYIDRFLEFAARADQVFAIGSKERFAVWTEHDGHHNGNFKIAMSVSFNNLFIEVE
jgi:hypothetical protein